MIACLVCSSVPRLEVFRDFTPQLRCPCGRLSVSRVMSVFRGCGEVIWDGPSFPGDVVSFSEDDVSRVVQRAVAHEVLGS